MSLTTAELALDVHDRMRRKPEPLMIAKPIADRALAELAERLPDVDLDVLAAVLLHTASVIGTQVLARLDSELIEADRFHLLTANVMAVAGERLWTRPDAERADAETGWAVSATRAEYTEALTHSNDAFEDFKAHLRSCPACRPVRLDCPTRDGLYATASRLRQAVDDIVTGWAEARRSAAAMAGADAEPR